MVCGYNEKNEEEMKTYDYSSLAESENIVQHKISADTFLPIWTIRIVVTVGPDTYHK